MFYLLKEHFKNVEMSPTSPGDVVLKLGKKKIAFEIETGKNMERSDELKTEEKFERIKMNLMSFM